MISTIANTCNRELKKDKPRDNEGRIMTEINFVDTDESCVCKWKDADRTLNFVHTVYVQELSECTSPV